MRSILMALGRGGTAALLSLWLWTAAVSAGPTLGGADTDADGVEDAFDNCTAVANPSQTDSNHDGCGDACTQSITCDHNGDTAVGVPDFVIQGMFLGMSVPPGPSGDCAPIGAPDGVVGIPDCVQLGMEFGHIVGPSGI